jgi:hypothetical protein
MAYRQPLSLNGLSGSNRLPVCIIKLSQNRGSLQTLRLTMRGLRTVLEEKLLGFYAHVGKFAKILIEGGHRRVFGRSGCRY